MKKLGIVKSLFISLTGKMQNLIVLFNNTFSLTLLKKLIPPLYELSQF